MTNGNPDTPQQLYILQQLDNLQQPDNYEAKTVHLKEALRDTEWQIDQQNKAFDSIERKAVQLITLYVVVIAFFGSLNIMWSKDFKILLITLTVLVAVLAAIAFMASLALESRPSEEVDNNSRDFLAEKNVNTMMQVLLGHYIKRYDINVLAIKKKAKWFLISLVMGRIIFPSIFVLFTIILWLTWGTST